MRRTLIIATSILTACKVGLIEPDPDAEVPVEEPDAAVAPDAPPGQPDAGDGTLTVVLEGQGGGLVVSSPAGIDCGMACTAQFAPGTPVSLTAMADATSRFVGWSDDCSGASATCPLLVDGDGALLATATFERLDVPVTVTIEGDGTGTVTSTPAGISCGGDCMESYPYASTVVLGATVPGGSEFLGWSGDCTGTGPCVLSMDAAKAVTATFRSVCVATPFVLGSPGTSTVMVPVGCRAATVKAWGAAGGGLPVTTYYGGGGGFATAKIPTTPGEVLQLVVGTGGGVAPNNGAGGGGGGSSAVARSVTALVVAGGGGGGGAGGSGGAAGGAMGVDGGFTSGSTIDHAGKGGTQSSPGAGGLPNSGGGGGLPGVGANGGAGGTNGGSTGGGGTAGTGWGTGGVGGNYVGGYGGGGGAGGGGYFGGGGAGGSGWFTAFGPGGGGGSSFVDSMGSTMRVTTAGSGATPGGSGDPDYASGVGVGSAGTGGNGRLVIIWLTE